MSSSMSSDCRHAIDFPLQQVIDKAFKEQNKSKKLDEKLTGTQNIKITKAKKKPNNNTKLESSLCPSHRSIALEKVIVFDKVFLSWVRIVWQSQ